MRSGYAKCLFGGALLAAGIVAPTQASVSQVGSRAALNGNNSIDWGQFGGYFTSVPSGSGGFTSPSNVPFTVSQPGGGGLLRLDQPITWNGNFAYGDRLIYNYGYSDTIHIDFATPTDRVGANIQAAYFGGFNGYINVFDTNGNSLGSFSSYGNSNSNGDGSALFLGVQSTGYDIAGVDFRVANLQGLPNSMAINQVDENYKAPAPGAAGLLGLAGLTATRRRRR